MADLRDGDEIGTGFSGLTDDGVPRFPRFRGSRFRRIPEPAAGGQ